MSVKKAFLNVHLWLGFASGLVIVVLGITGCLLAFETEIRQLSESFRFVAVEDKPYQHPSVLKTEAEKYLDGKKLNAIEYPGKGRAVIASYYDTEEYKLVALNPYSGKMLKVKNMNDDFFRVVLRGHYYLWLPEKTGQLIVASATLIFLLMLITGLVLWWPKNRAARKQRFNIKWNARWRRLNYDLHNVLGFYMTWVAIFITITGLVFGFQWFARSFYWLSSGGTPLLEEVHPASDLRLAKPEKVDIADRLWLTMSEITDEQESIALYYPLTGTDPLEIAINHEPGTYYNMDFYHFDQYSGIELLAKGVYTGSFKDAKLPDKIKRMNYDIHVGAILGLPGKVLAFFASLVAASLPVTGFYIWWGRRNKTGRKSMQMKSHKVLAGPALTGKGPVPE